MLAKQILILAITATLLSVSASAQGEFIEREQSSFELAPLFTFGENANGYGFSLGYCANGYLGIGFAYAKNDDLNAQGYGPMLAGHLLKNEYGNGLFGASVYLTFERTKFKIDDTTSIHNTYIIGGAGVYYNYYMNDWLTIQPSFVTTVSVDLESSWEEGNQSFGDKLSFFQHLGLSFTLTRDETYHPFVTGGLTIPSESSESIYGDISIGLIAVF